MKTETASFVAASAKKRSYQFNREERLESERVAKEIFHKIITGVCGEHGRQSPGTFAVASWNVSNMNVIRSGLHFAVMGSKFQGSINVRSELEAGTYTIDFMDTNLTLEAPVKVLSISSLSGPEITDAIDAAVERCGMVDTVKWGNRAMHTKGFKVDLDTNDAVEWNESSFQQREAVVYDLFIRNPNANLSHMQNVPLIAHRDWQGLSATERIMLVDFNVADALAEFKHNESDTLKLS
ncbi:MAG: hypothetical protein Q7K26_01845 [bacterium]|nr:hypothetical protein [bacterium]